MRQMGSKGNKQKFWKDIQILKASLNILLQRIEVKTEFDDSIVEKDVLKKFGKGT